MNILLRLQYKTSIIIIHAIENEGVKNETNNSKRAL